MGNNQSKTTSKTKKKVKKEDAPKAKPWEYLKLRPKKPKKDNDPPKSADEEATKEEDSKFSDESKEGMKVTVFVPKEDKKKGKK